VHGAPPTPPDNNPFDDFLDWLWPFDGHENNEDRNGSQGGSTGDNARGNDEYGWPENMPLE
jgi:hypothetical protein